MWHRGYKPHLWVWTPVTSPIKREACDNVEIQIFFRYYLRWLLSGNKNGSASMSVKYCRGKPVEKSVQGRTRLWPVFYQHKLNTSILIMHTSLLIICRNCCHAVGKDNTFVILIYLSIQSSLVLLCANVSLTIWYTWLSCPVIF